MSSMPGTSELRISDASSLSGLAISTSGVDENAFLKRVFAALDDIVAAADHEDTVAVFGHGGVINVILHRILGTAKLLSFPIDYASITRLRYSRSGRFTVAEVNGTEHVWDLLPRNAR